MEKLASPVKKVRRWGSLQLVVLGFVCALAAAIGFPAIFGVVFGF